MVNDKNVTKKKKMEIVFYLLVNQSFSIKVKQTKVNCMKYQMLAL